MPAGPRNRKLIDPITLPLAGTLPEPLEGLRVLQISDLHVRRARARHEQLLREAAEAQFDLLVFTGDIMHRPGHEPAAEGFMRRLMQVVKPRYGSFGCFGNHDSSEFRRRIADLPVKWLCDQCFDHPDLPIRLMGLDGRERGRCGDMVAMLLNSPPPPPEEEGGRFRVLLTHEPSWLPAAADAGIELALSGHTHGGQVRLPGNIVMYNCQRYWPLRYTTGILRCGPTTMLISRGLGEAYVERLRLFCPPHAPLITLAHAPGSESDDARRDGIQVLRRW